ncbi:MAG: glycosyltransferase family 2 protein [Acidobacteria bacterium]|nr:glycosyltransferase family 2 protein [Acidobacteriota bacterium]
MTAVRREVSVLIPVRNGEPFLAETIEAALAQTLPPLEVIVVDDGSTDGSREVAVRFAPRVSVVSNTAGRGASAARTCASRLARGAYFQYVDADDLLHPHALEARVSALEATGAAVAISDWRRLVPSERGWCASKTEVGDLASLAPPWDLRVFEGFWAPPAAILYRRSVFEAVGQWHDGLPVIQDARFLFDAVRHGARPVHVHGVGADYRQHGAGSLSSASASRFWGDVYRNALEVETMWRETNELDAPHRRALADAYALCARTSVAADQELFAQSCAALRRFADHHRSRFGRAAAALSGWFGASVARTVLNAARRREAPPA